MMFVLVLMFVLVWFVFFNKVEFGSYVIWSHLLSWVVLIVVDEMNILRAIAAVTLVVSFFIFVGVIFNYLLHKSVRGFLKD